jgi:hypothetical protein
MPQSLWCIVKHRYYRLCGILKHRYYGYYLVPQSLCGIRKHRYCRTHAAACDTSIDTIPGIRKHRCHRTLQGCSDSMYLCLRMPGIVSMLVSMYIHTIAAALQRAIVCMLTYARDSIYASIYLHTY